MKLGSTAINRLGAIPFWRSEEKCLESLALLYERAADKARAALEKNEKQMEAAAKALAKNRKTTKGEAR